MNKYDILIKKLNLIPHPEGGHFSETFRDSSGNLSHIYYLLKKGEVSHWHKLTKNENLHFYDGYPLKILLSEDKINTYPIILGNNINKGERYNYIVKAETWFSMIPLGGWSLIGCNVAPALEYVDFELAPPYWKPGNK